ncbi:MAG: hypothetical protein FWC22_01660 [Treponema sp.]|nr:hypothetical protein [Treponema sp.]
MKKTVLFGLLVILLVFGFISCDINGNGPCTLVIVNEYAQPITRVLVGHEEGDVFFNAENLNITESQTFTFDPPDGVGYTNVYVYAVGLTGWGGGGKASGFGIISSGNKVTITLKVDGDVSSNTEQN